MIIVKILFFFVLSQLIFAKSYYLDNIPNYTDIMNQDEWAVFKENISTKYEVNEVILVEDELKYKIKVIITAKENIYHPSMVVKQIESIPGAFDNISNDTQIGNDSVEWNLEKLNNGFIFNIYGEKKIIKKVFSDIRRLKSLSPYFKMIIKKGFLISRSLNYRVLDRKKFLTWKTEMDCEFERPRQAYCQSAYKLLYQPKPKCFGRPEVTLKDDFFQNIIFDDQWSQSLDAKKEMALSDSPCRSRLVKDNALDHALRLILSQKDNGKAKGGIFLPIISWVKAEIIFSNNVEFVNDVY